MIQRIQSIFLFLAALAYAGFFFLPLASTEKAYEDILADKIYNINDSVILLVLAIAGGLLALINIFLFKNRPLQIRLSYVSIIIGILVPIAAFIIFMQETSEEAYQQASFADGFALYLPIFIILFLYLAVKYIRKDSKLVKSMDRLR